MNLMMSKVDENIMIGATDNEMLHEQERSLQKEKEKDECKHIFHNRSAKFDKNVYLEQ